MIRRIIAVLICATSAWTHASDYTDQLNQLVNTGRMEQAYELALNEVAGLAGTPEFDLPYGIAAIDTGRVNEGLFALERVLFVQPSNHRARLEYARGLFILGEDAQARQAFTQVLENASPPPSVAEKINQFLAAIRLRESRYATTARGYFGFSVGYDSNINSAPETQPSLVTLSSESLGQEDSFSKLLFGGQLFHPISKITTLYGRWDSRMLGYADESAQNNGSHQLTLGSRWRTTANQYDAGIAFQHYRLNNEAYRNLYGPTLQWTHVFDPQLSLQTSFSWLELDYPDLKFRDARQGLANVRLFGRFEGAGSPSWFAGAYYGDERSDAQSATSLAAVDRHFYGLQLGGQFSLSSSLSLLTTAVVQNSRYEGTDFLYGVKRDDRYTALDLELKKLLTTELQASINLNVSDNHANIELYDYRREQVTFALRYDF